MGRSGTRGRAPVSPARPARVLFVHTGVDWIRGSERCLLDLVGGLDRRRFDPVVWCDTPTLAAEARALGAEVEMGDPSWGAAANSLLPPRPLVREAEALLRRHDVRVVHANNPVPLKWMLPAARAARIPTLLHVHLPTTQDERVFNGAHQAAMVVGVSRSAVRGFLDDGMAASRVSVIYNGVDPKRLSAGDETGLRAAFGIAPDDVVIAAVGSLIARKGVDTLLRAFALLRRREPKVRLLIVGDGEERAGLERLACSLGLDGAVDFLGERRDAGAILRDAADIAASAAREEAFPLNLLEAALFGLPVAASAIPPHHESIVVGETGLLAPPEDPAAFAAILETLVVDRALRRRIGEAGRARIEREFLASRYVASFEAAYESLLERPRGSYGWLRGTTFPRAYWGWIGGAVARKVARYLRAQRGLLAGTAGAGC